MINSNYEEQITIFLENFLYDDYMRGYAPERVGHFHPGDPNPLVLEASSRSAMSYLRGSDLTNHDFVSNDLNVEFRFDSGEHITKIYRQGRYDISSKPASGYLDRLATLAEQSVAGDSGTIEGSARLLPRASAAGSVPAGASKVRNLPPIGHIACSAATT